MSIDSKIQEILEESKLAGLVSEDEHHDSDEILGEGTKYEEGDWHVIDNDTGEIHSTHSTPRKASNKMNKLNDAMYEKDPKDPSRVNPNEPRLYHNKYSIISAASHSKKPACMAKESVDMSADVDALMNGESLSEEFRTKAATIFESAVVTRVQAEVARLEEEFESKLEEQVESITEGLVEKIDGYLDYVVEQWIEQNEIALESGVKADIMESFISGMKGLFQEHYIEIPEEKYDVLGEMEAKIDSLESKLTEQVEKNIEMKKIISESTRREIIKNASEGLTITESEKFTDLVNAISYEDEATFKVKVDTLRENYFAAKPYTSVATVVSDSPVENLDESVQYKSIDPVVAAYANAIKQFSK